MEMKSNRQLYFKRDDCKEIEIEENKKFFNKKKRKRQLIIAKNHFIRSNVIVALLICTIRI
jgi:hypothetical protein